MTIIIDSVQEFRDFFIDPSPDEDYDYDYKYSDRREELCSLAYDSKTGVAVIDGKTFKRIKVEFNVPDGYYSPCSTIVEVDGNLFSFDDDYASWRDDSNMGDAFWDKNAIKMVRPVEKLMMVYEEVK